MALATHAAWLPLAFPEALVGCGGDDTRGQALDAAAEAAEIDGAAEASDDADGGEANAGGHEGGRRRRGAGREGMNFGALAGACNGECGSGKAKGRQS